MKTIRELLENEYIGVKIPVYIQTVKGENSSKVVSYHLQGYSKLLRKQFEIIKEDVKHCVIKKLFYKDDVKDDKNAIIVEIDGVDIEFSYDYHNPIKFDKGLTRSQLYEGILNRK